MNKLLVSAGKKAAELARAPPGYTAHIVTGAAASIVLSVCASMTGDDKEKIARLPDTTGMNSKILCDAASDTVSIRHTMELNRVAHPFRRYLLPLPRFVLPRFCLAALCFAALCFAARCFAVSLRPSFFCAALVLLFGCCLWLFSCVNTALESKHPFDGGQTSSARLSD